MLLGRYPNKHVRVACQLVKHSMFTVFLFFKQKELFTGEGCVEMDNPWQLCRTIGPLLSQRFPLASAKAQPRGDFQISLNINNYEYLWYPRGYFMIYCVFYNVFHHVYVQFLVTCNFLLNSHYTGKIMAICSNDLA